MKKKYTMEDFFEIFQEAEVKTLEKIAKDFKEAGKDENPMTSMLFNLQNVMVMTELKKEIFKDILK